MSLVEGLLRGDKRAVAKLISLIEDGSPQASEVVRQIYPRTGQARVIGVSGPPGAGKSTLIYRLACLYRDKGRTVGIIAVDPTSPITGGALLGDRIRMGKLTSDEGVFIRSMGTRGRLGGVSAATSDAINVLDAYGSDIIFVETIGAGQSDVEVASLVHTTVVVVMPGAGDEVQALKAGLFEVADVFVVNKADMGDAERVAADLRMVLEMGEEDGWRPPVLLTTARDGAGIEEVAGELENHFEYMRTSGQLEERRRRRIEREVLAALSETIMERGLSLRSGEAFQAYVKRVMNKEMSPREAASKILEELSGSA